MADQKRFLGLEGHSSRSDDQGPPYQVPIDSSGVDAAVDAPPTEPPTIQQPAPAPALDGGGGAELAVGTGTHDQFSRRVYPKSDVPTSDVLHPEYDPENQGRNSVMVAHTPPGHSIKMETSHAHLVEVEDHLDDGIPEDLVGAVQPTKHSRCSVCLKALVAALIGLGCIVKLLTIILWVLREKLPDHYLWGSNCSTAEILRNGTILAYRGSSSNVGITSNLEDVSLFVTDCGDLLEHEMHFEIHNKIVPLISDQPFLMPAYYQRYEVGSIFDFWVTMASVPASSNLSILIFSNTSEAKYYKHHYMEPNAQMNATVIPLENSTIFPVTFIPSYGGYFNPMLDPKISGRGFDIYISYVVKQIFYLHSDYTPYKDCSLTITGTCSFTLPTQNETCILAYNPPALTANTAMLNIDIKTKKIQERPIPTIVCFLLLALSAGFLLIFIVLILICVYKRCACKQAVSYTQVPTEHELTEDN